jgi:rhamnose transport system ATP-binding protein
VSITSAQVAIRYGIAYLPEDRRKHGVIGELSIGENITLASLGKTVGQKLSGIDFGVEREIASAYIKRFGIKTPAVFSPVSTLSGGNQQKVALSRWLATDPTILILDEPTQGIDVGAKAEIHELMMELVEQGMAILMISSELPEILGMSDRIAVMRNGTICGELGREDATQERLLSIALGHQDRQFSLDQS